MPGDRPTATVVIRNMEKQGLARRSRDPENRKRVRVASTAEGRRKTKSLAGWREGTSPDPFGALSMKEEAMLENILGKIEERLQEIVE